MVELAGITFTGEPAKNKKQAEKNAAMAAWSSLKQLAKETASSSSEPEINDELEQITIARALLNYRQKEKMAVSNPNSLIPFQRKFQIQHPRPSSPQPLPATTSKILPLICQKTAPRNKPSLATTNEGPRSRHPLTASDSSMLPPQSSALESRVARPMKFPAAGAAPYVPLRQMRSCHGIAPAVNIRSVVPVYSAPPLPPPGTVPHQVIRASTVQLAPPVTIRQAVPVYAAPPVRKDEPAPIQKQNPPTQFKEEKLPPKINEMDAKFENALAESRTAQILEQLKI
ncbi:Double-stranded RNA-binding protein [Stylosanthes scabra]|uniref:Double-stranded RNA-binding protein n=1 Tax=Stylosanthes scabra TaxID=79078 RepID=A0ABU6TUF1_9FABA|nr:Double-stranded RNA-binding protein [Stylosanthes scabra]